MANPWFVRAPRSDAARLALVCFPYAGGGSTVFRNWTRLVPSEIEVVRALLPARERRIAETPVRRMDQLVRALVDVCRAELRAPYAFFGHSLGALVAFELARALRDAGLPSPVRLFASGCRAPQVPRTRADIHALPDDEFLAAVERFGGIPREVLAERELMQLFLPALRGDFELYETHRFEPRAPLDCPITAFGGEEDERVSREALEAWRETTRGAFASQRFPGGHFFPLSSEAAVVEHIARELALASRSPV